MTVYNTVNNSSSPTAIDEGGKAPLSTAYPNYPESNLETMFGPVLLPKIYAKGLSALEIASSGDIILSINDFETLNISNDETSRETIFQSTSNYHLKFYPNDADTTVQVGDHTWTSETIDAKDYQVLRTSQSGGYMLSNDLVVTGTLDLAGNTAFSGAVAFGSTLSIAGATNMDNTLSVKSDVFMSSNLSVLGNTEMAGSLSVQGVSILQNTLSVGGASTLESTLSVKDDVFMSSNLSVLGNTEMAGSLSVQGVSILKNTLSVGGASTLENTLSVKDDVFLSSSLSVLGNTEMAGTLSIQSDVFLSSDISVAADAYFTGPIMKIPIGPESDRPSSLTAPAGSIYFNSNTYRFEGLHDLGSGSKSWLPFGGVIDIDSDTYITAEKTTDDDTLGFYADNADTPRMTMTSALLSVNLPVVMNNTLSVKDASTLTSTLSVGAHTELASTLSVLGNTQLIGTLSVNNVAYFNETAKIGNNLSVQSTTTLASTLSVGSDTFMSSNLSVLGNTEMDGTLSVKSEVFMSSSLSVLGNTEMAGSLSVQGVSILQNTLSVGGASTLDNTLSVKSDVFMSSNLSVLGNTQMAGTLSVQGVTFLENILSVGGASVLDNTLSVKSDVFLSSNLSVLGNTQMAGTLSVQDASILKSTLSVGGNTIMNTNLSVGAHTVLKETLSVGSASILNSTLSVSGETTLSDNLSVNLGVYIDSTNNGTLYTNTIKDFTNQQGGGTLTIDVETLVVSGNIDVGGTYNTVDISASTIAVEDKLLILATSSDYTGGDVDDGVTDDANTNGSSGLKIAGKPSVDNLTTAGMSTLASSNVWEKSFKWQMNSGMEYLGYLKDDVSNDATLRDQESFWELKGGAFHIAADKFDDDGAAVTVKYGFRINANDELEIIKKTGTNASKRVAKFGITSAF